MFGDAPSFFRVLCERGWGFRLFRQSFKSKRPSRERRAEAKGERIPNLVRKLDLRNEVKPDIPEQSTGAVHGGCPAGILPAARH
jgi:hypothetical protein